VRLVSPAISFLLQFAPGREVDGIFGLRQKNGFTTVTNIEQRWRREACQRHVLPFDNPCWRYAMSARKRPRNLSKPVLLSMMTILLDRLLGAMRSALHVSPGADTSTPCHNMANHRQ